MAQSGVELFHSSRISGYDCFKASRLEAPCAPDGRYRAVSLLLNIPSRSREFFCALFSPVLHSPSPSYLSTARPCQTPLLWEILSPFPGGTSPLFMHRQQRQNLCRSSFLIPYLFSREQETERPLHVWRHRIRRATPPHHRKIKNCITRMKHKVRCPQFLERTVTKRKQANVMSQSMRRVDESGIATSILSTGSGQSLKL